MTGSPSESLYPRSGLHRQVVEHAGILKDEWPVSKIMRHMFSLTENDSSVTEKEKAVIEAFIRQAPRSLAAVAVTAPLTRHMIRQGEVAQAFDNVAPALLFSHDIWHMVLATYQSDGTDPTPAYAKPGSFTERALDVDAHEEELKVSLLEPSLSAGVHDVLTGTVPPGMETLTKPQWYQDRIKELAPLQHTDPRTYFIHAVRALLVYVEEPDALEVLREEKDKISWEGVRQHLAENPGDEFVRIAGHFYDYFSTSKGKAEPSRFYIDQFMRLTEGFQKRMAKRQEATSE